MNQNFWSRIVLVIGALSIGFALIGCSSGGGDEETKKLSGKVEEVKPPEGWTPPGDSKPGANNPSAADKSKDEGG